MKNIEVEVRSFVNKKQFDELNEYFIKNATLVKEDNQESHYFDTEQDFRIQKNDYYSKIWLKKGSMHDSWREEVEIKFDKSDFDKLVTIFESIGLNTKIKWFRHRVEYEWDGVRVDLDFTKGYGYIIELEKMSNIKNAENVHNELTNKMNDLGVKISSKKDFDSKLKFYAKNWKKLTS